MSFRRPNSLLLKARNPPIAINTVCRELAEVGLNSHVVGIQRIRQGERCVTLKSRETADLAQSAFAESNDMELISERLKVNEQGTCRLEGVPVEYANSNIHKSLCEFFDGLIITDEIHKNLPEGFPPVKTGNRLLKYDKIRKRPEKRVYLGMGVSGYLNDLERKNIEEANITCQNCASESHITRLCELPTRCRKCGENGHKKEECEAGDCRRCDSGFHSTELCPRISKTCEKCSEKGHIGRECLIDNNVVTPFENENEPTVAKHSIIFVKEILSDTLFLTKTKTTEKSVDINSTHSIENDDAVAIVSTTSTIVSTTSNTSKDTESVGLGNIRTVESDDALETNQNELTDSVDTNNVDREESDDLESIYTADSEAENINTAESIESVEPESENTDSENNDNTVDGALQKENLAYPVKKSVGDKGQPEIDKNITRVQTEIKILKNVDKNGTNVEKGKRNRDKISTDEDKEKRKSKKKKEIERPREEKSKERKDISVEEIIDSGSEKIKN